MSEADLDKRLTTHEAVCAERYGALRNELGAVLARMSRVEKIMLGVAGTIICGMAAMIWQLAKFG